MSTRAWPAVLLAPVLALVDQGVAYVFVGWSCSHQTMVPLHAVHAIFLAAVLATALAPWRRLEPAAPPTLRVDEHERRNFFALVGVLVVALSALVIIAMWIPQWFISPCVG